MAEDGDTIHDALLAVAAARIAERGWRAFDPGGDPDLRDQFRDKRAVLSAFAHAIDVAVRSGIDDDARDPAFPVRERLLEVLMLRFDAMRPYRAGLGRVLRALPSDPQSALGGLPVLRAAMRDSLTAVGIEPRGICGALQVKGLCLVFLAGLRVWLDDDGDDLSATMRELDTRLRQAGDLLTALGLGRAPAGGETPAGAGSVD